MRTSNLIVLLALFATSMAIRPSLAPKIQKNFMQLASETAEDGL